MDLFYILLHNGGGKKKKPKVAVLIYADGVVRDKIGILIHCWCKYNLVYLFQNTCEKSLINSTAKCMTATTINDNSSWALTLC